MILGAWEGLTHAMQAAFLESGTTAFEFATREAAVAMGESVGENGGDAARSDDGVRGGDPIGLPSFPDQLRISLRSATAVSAPIRIKSSWCEPSEPLLQ